MDIDSEYAAIGADLATRRSDADVVALLDRELLLMDVMGSPQRGYPAIHIGGTNGKTSTAAIADALIRAFGLRTGRFTSPDVDLAKHISVHGSPITAEQFVATYREVIPYAELVDRKLGDRLTRFEILTAMAFATFADAPVDVAVVEVGMGGSWDSTNVLDAQISVLAPIGLDHQRYLGETIDEIATEKAGIIKPGATAISAVQQEEAREPIQRRCHEVGATLLYEGSDFGVLRRDVAVGGQRLTIRGLGGVYDDLFLPLHGAHQAHNAALALAAVETFLGAGSHTRQLDPEVVRDGLASATSPGRLERIRSAPTILLDAAHNPHGMAVTVAALTQDFSFRRLVAVVGVFADKDAVGILELLEPVVDVVICTRNSSPRAMSAQQLAALATDLYGEDRVRVEAAMPDAIAAAVIEAEADLDGDMSGVGVLITGSVVTVADARKLLAR